MFAQTAIIDAPKQPTVGLRMFRDLSELEKLEAVLATVKAPATQNELHQLSGVGWASIPVSDLTRAEALFDQTKVAEGDGGSLHWIPSDGGARHEVYKRLNVDPSTVQRAILEVTFRKNSLSVEGSI